MSEKQRREMFKTAKHELVLDLAEIDSITGVRTKEPVLLPNRLRTKPCSVQIDQMIEENAYMGVYTDGSDILLPFDSKMYRQESQKKIDGFLEQAVDAVERGDLDASFRYSMKALVCRTHYQEVQEKIVIPYLEKVDVLSRDFRTEENKQKIMDEVVMLAESDTVKHDVITVEKKDGMVLFSTLINGEKVSASFKETTEFRKYSEKELADVVTAGLSEWNIVNSINKPIYRDALNHDPDCWAKWLNQAMQSEQKKEEELRKKYRSLKDMPESTVRECTDKLNRIHTIISRNHNQESLVNIQFSKMVAESLAINRYQKIYKNCVEELKSKRNNNYEAMIKFYGKIPIIGEPSAHILRKTFNYLDEKGIGDKYAKQRAELREKIKLMESGCNQFSNKVSRASVPIIKKDSSVMQAMTAMYKAVTEKQKLMMPNFMTEPTMNLKKVQSK